MEDDGAVVDGVVDGAVVDVVVCYWYIQIYSMCVVKAGEVGI